MEPALIFGVFLASLAQVVAGTAVPMFLSDAFGAGPFVIGLAGGLNQSVYFLTTLVSSVLVQMRFPLFLLAPCFFCVIYAALPSLPLSLFVGLYVASAFFYARYWAPIQDCLRSSRASSVNNYNLSFSAGILLGTVSAGLLYERSRTLPFHAAAWLSLPVALVFLVMARNILKIRTKRTAQVPAARQAFPAPQAWRIRTLFFLQFGTYGLLISTFPKLCLDMPQKGYTPSVIAGLIAFYYAVRLAAFAALRNRSVVENRAVFLASCLATAAGISWMPLAPDARWASAAMLLAGVPMSLAYHNSFLFHLRAGLPTELHQAIISAGALFGAFATGILGERIGLGNAFFLYGLFIAAAGLALAAVLPDKEVSTVRT